MRYITGLLGILSIFLFSFAAPPENLDEARASFCKSPPFLSQNVLANVLLVIDISGSMRFDAYGSYKENKRFTGYWDYDAVYMCYDAEEKKYVSESECRYEDNRYWVKYEDNYCQANDVSPCPKKVKYSVYDADKRKYVEIKGRTGNYLNNAWMTRLDVIRWVLTGGFVTDNEEDHQHVIKTYREDNKAQAIKVEDVTSYNPTVRNVEGILQKIEKLAKHPRIGAYFYEEHETIAEKVKLSYDYSNLINAINTIELGGYTPTGPALEEAMKLFSRQDGTYGFKITPDTDPYIFTINGKQKVVRCAKNYVLLFTDGEWNRGVDPIEPAYQMWKGGYADLVPGLDGNQNVKLYSVALFMDEGKGLRSVKNVAIFGGFNDIDGSGMPCGYDDYDEDDLPNSKDKRIVDITKPEYKSCRNEWDAEPQDGLPDTFASGDNPEQVKTALEKVFESVLSDIFSGTAISVLSGKKSQSSVLAQAIFSPERYINGYKVKWIGQLFNYWFLNIKDAQNMREDTDENKVLNIKKDKILEFNVDIAGKLTIDVYNSDNNGQKAGKFRSYRSLNEIKDLWEAGESLRDTDANDRVIYAVDDSGNLEEFTETNAAKFKNNLGTSASHFPDCLKNGSKISYKKLIKYIRGEDIRGCRSRKVNDTGNNAGDVWKLGDIIYSTPRIVKYSNYSVVYTASNDGILHAFKLGKVVTYNSSEGDIAKLEGTDLGKELWGFIPSSAMAFLRYLADPNYCHMYIHDLSPYIVNANGKMILIGGLRFGGGCSCSGDYCVQPPSDTPNAFSEYYALDITDPTDPKLLWEFKDPDLGFSYSGPGIIKATNDKYYVVFASGPTSYSAQLKNYNKKLKIFILDLETGHLEKSIDTNINKAFAGRIFSNGYDLNGNGYTDFIVFGYTRQDGSEKHYKGGVIFLSGKCEGNKFYPLDSESDVNKWQACDIRSLGTDIPPVTAKVEIGKCFNNWYLFLGTGRWFEKNDDWEVQQSNILFGVPLKPDKATGTTWNYSGYKYVELQTGTQPVRDAGHIHNICLDNSHGNIRGWYIRLDEKQGKYLKEKAVSDPSVTDFNVVFFPTMYPSSDFCDYGGITRVWALNCATGDSINSNSCPGYKITNTNFVYLLQLSGGDVRQLKKSSFTEESQRATKKFRGIPAEEGGVPVLPGTKSLEGEIILWIEK